MLDWQLVDRSRGGRDLSYLIGGSLTVENREAHEEKLVRRYVDGLAAAGVTGYGFDVAWNDYRLGVLFAFVYSIIAGGSLNHEDPRATELVKEMFKRSIAAIDYLDCLALVD